MSLLAVFHLIYNALGPKGSFMYKLQFGQASPTVDIIIHPHCEHSSTPRSQPTRL